MFPIIRSEVESLEVSMPHFPMRVTKLSVVIDNTQDIILQLLINTVEIYLAEEEVFRNKGIENTANSSEWKYGKRSKENKLKAPYKDRKGKPFHYNWPNESLFYKEMMAKEKITP